MKAEDIQTSKIESKRKTVDKSIGDEQMYRDSVTGRLS